jgi:hypothetical protein
VFNSNKREEFIYLNSIIEEEVKNFNSTYKTKFTVEDVYLTKNYKPHITLISENNLERFAKENQKDLEILKDEIINAIQKALPGPPLPLPIPQFNYAR